MAAMAGFFDQGSGALSFPSRQVTRTPTRPRPGQVACQPEHTGLFPRADVGAPGGNQDADVAQWWRTMQKICEASDNNLQETNELVKELAEWSHIMQNMIESNLNAPPSESSRFKEQTAACPASIDAMRDENTHLEHTNSRMRGVFVVMFTLWKIASQRQKCLLERNRNLLTRLALSLLLQQMSVHHARISQTLAVDPDIYVPVPEASLMTDVASIEALAANIATLLTHADVSSLSSCNTSTYIPGKGQSATIPTSSSTGYDVFDALDALLHPRSVCQDSISGNPEPPLALAHVVPPPPPPTQPGAFQVYASSTANEMPMPRFAMRSQSNTAAVQDPELVCLSL